MHVGAPNMYHSYALYSQFFHSRVSSDINNCDTHVMSALLTATSARAYFTNI